jgi:hypothetical protein
MNEQQTKENKKDYGPEVWISGKVITPEGKDPYVMVKTFTIDHLKRKLGRYVSVISFTSKYKDSERNIVFTRSDSKYYKKPYIPESNDAVFVNGLHKSNQNATYTRSNTVDLDEIQQVLGNVVFINIIKSKKSQYPDSRSFLFKKSDAKYLPKEFRSESGSEKTFVPRTQAAKENDDIEI